MEDVHPFTCCVALVVISPTPRVVQMRKTALMVAIENKNEAMVTALLDHNANPDIQDGVRQGPQSGYEGLKGWICEDNDMCVGR